MNVIELLSRLHSLDIKIWVEDNNLRYSAPEGAFTPDLRAEVSQQKAELITFLRQVETAAKTGILPIQPILRDQPLQLSFAQQRLWFLQQLHPESYAYNIPLFTRINGPLNINTLEHSLRQIIHRHESLRTTFDMAEQSPVQIIHPVADYQLPVIDCTPEEAEQFMAGDAKQPFDLTQGPLVRTKLLQLDSQEYILYLNFHHIIFDGWSLDRFVHELTTLYKVQGVASNAHLLPELPIQYADFATWERQRFGTAGDEGLAYWRQKLAGELPTLQLPTDYPRPTVQRSVGNKHEFILSRPLTQTLKQLSQEQNVTLFMTLLAAFKTLLHRYSGQNDILVGVPSANRTRRSVNNLIGFFVNTLVFRTNVSGTPTFLELLSRIREVTLEAQTYQDTPFEKLVEELHPARDLSRQPLFQVMFVLQPPTGEFGGSLDLPGTTATPLKMIKNNTAKFDLILEMFEGESGLVGTFEYSTDLFNEDTIDRMAGHLQMLVEGIAANPNQNIYELPLLTVAEQHQMLVEWNDTGYEYPKRQSILQLFEDQVERIPNEISVVFEEQHLSYADLNVRANQLAHHLQTLGVKPDTVVAICADRSLDMIIGMMGILKAGGAYLPLDPMLPKDRLRFMVDDARVQILLTQQPYAELWADQDSTIVYLDTNWKTIARQPNHNPVSQTHTQNLAYVLFTSGSTGRPKGVGIEHQHLLNYLNSINENLEFPPGATFATVSTFATDLGNTVIFPALCGGGCLHVISQDRASDAKALAEYFENNPIDCLKIVPSHLAALLIFSQPEKILPRQRLILGGEASHWDLIKKVQTLAPECVIFNHYGPTETTVGVLTHRINPNQIEDGFGVVPLGRPIANTQIYLLDAHLQPVPVGVAGEMYIGGANVARGYLHHPDLTAERFIASPFAGFESGSDNTEISPPACLYKTGDLARYQPDGKLEFLGRVDNQIKIRGFRIELGEIDTQLTQHPSVQQALTLAREDNGYDKRLVAYIVPEAEDSLTTTDLRDFLKQNLPDPMIPAAFVFLDRFPLTLNGKINQRALPIPDAVRPELLTEYATPRNEVEMQLAQIWTEVLGVDRVGIHDNFFELGGHSLQVVQIVFQLRQRFHQGLALRDFFNTATVATLAKAVQTLDKSPDTNSEDSINLEAEVNLAPSIYPNTLAGKPFATATFLTGATGFLGAFLLAEILQKTGETVYCLVRSVDTNSGYQRIEDTLRSYLLWDENFKSRITPIVGDLASPQLGLSPREFKALAAQINTIYHCGAEVNFVYPYHKLKPANVAGTQDILRLAAENNATVHYISTLSVFASEKYFDGRTIYEDDDLTDSQGLINGYSQSKWVAEKLVLATRARGLDVVVYRPGLVVGHSQTGAWKTGDLLTTFIQGCVQLGSMPNIDRVWHMIPANFVSSAIIYLSQKPQSPGKVFHLTTPYSLSTSELQTLIQSLGYPLRLISYAEWRTELINCTKHNPDHPLYPLFLIFAQSKERKDIYTKEKVPHYDCQNVLDGLSDSGIVCPPVNQKVLATYFSYFVNCSFLTTP